VKTLAIIEFQSFITPSTANINFRTSKTTVCDFFCTCGRDTWLTSMKEYKLQLGVLRNNKFGKIREFKDGTW